MKNSPISVKRWKPVWIRAYQGFPNQLNLFLNSVQGRDGFQQNFCKRGKGIFFKSVCLLKAPKVYMRHVFAYLYLFSSKRLYDTSLWVVLG